MLAVNSSLIRIIDRLQNGYSAGKSDITFLLGLSDPNELTLLFAAAREVRARYFGEKIFLYGFLYFSTYCRNNCSFCQYRRSNTLIPRYRKTGEQILAAAKEMAAAGVHLIDLTMGEDPELYSAEQFGVARFVNMVGAVKAETGLPVMVSPGTLPDEVLADLADMGVTWYACYQETHSRELFGKLRQGQEYQQRINKKQYAKRRGMLIEEGILTGVGESLDDLAESILWMKESGVDQARVMTFVPQAGTPMAFHPAQDSLGEQIVIAVMRLVLRDVLIPASLDVGGLSGLKERLNAGANVVTSIVPPRKGLAGVASTTLDIEESRRSLSLILPVLREVGLRAALPGDYIRWVSDRKNDGRGCCLMKEQIKCG